MDLKFLQVTTLLPTYYLCIYYVRTYIESRPLHISTTVQTVTGFKQARKTTNVGTIDHEKDKIIAGSTVETVYSPEIEKGGADKTTHTNDVVRRATVCGTKVSQSSLL